MQDGACVVFVTVFSWIYLLVCLPFVLKFVPFNRTVCNFVYFFDLTWKLDVKLRHDDGQSPSGRASAACQPQRCVNLRCWYFFRHSMCMNISKVLLNLCHILWVLICIDCSILILCLTITKKISRINATKKVAFVWNNCWKVINGVSNQSWVKLNKKMFYRR